MAISNDSKTQDVVFDEDFVDVEAEPRVPACHGSDLCQLDRLLGGGTRALECKLCFETLGAGAIDLDHQQHDVYPHLLHGHHEHHHQAGGTLPSASGFGLRGCPIDLGSRLLGSPGALDPSLANGSGEQRPSKAHRQLWIPGDPWDGDLVAAAQLV